MRDNIYMYFNEEQAGLIMLMMQQVDWTDETIGHIAEGIFTSFADRGIQSAPAELLKGDDHA